jgi:hypothetical protein
MAKEALRTIAYGALSAPVPACSCAKGLAAGVGALRAALLDDGGGVGVGSSAQQVPPAVAAPAPTPPPPPHPALSIDGADGLAPAADAFLLSRAQLHS